MQGETDARTLFGARGCRLKTFTPNSSSSQLAVVTLRLVLQRRFLIRWRQQKGSTEGGEMKTTVGPEETDSSGPGRTAESDRSALKAHNSFKRRDRFVCFMKEPSRRGFSE